MKPGKQKYFFISLIIALIFWFIDSVIHHFVYGEAVFEFIPSSFNELWMRMVIFFLVIGFGIYVDLSVSRMSRLQEERFKLQKELDNALTKLLSGFVKICCECKKVRNPGVTESDRENWETIESYISHHTGLEFTHGYCPDCAAIIKKSINDRSS